MERRLEQNKDRPAARPKNEAQRRRERHTGSHELERHLEVVIDMATD
jgi:hypothetical protein